MIGRYTCLTKQLADFYENIIEDPDTAEIINANLGWWDYEFNKTVSNVAEGKAANRNNEPIKVGSAFLLTTSMSIGRKITSAGAVPMESKSISTASQHPFIANFVPTTIKLGQIEIESVDEEEPFDADVEYFQVLDPADTHVIGRYTCLTKQLADFYENIIEDPDTAEIINANLGWWDYEFNKTVSNVADGKSTNRDNVDVRPGDAFLLTTSMSIGRTIKFPAAISEEK